MTSALTIRPAQFPEDQAELACMLREYAAEFPIDICFTQYEQELAQLPGKYAPPYGSLLLVLMDQQHAGCVAIRPLTQTIGEMKRLYVRPTYRKAGLGKQLVESVIQSARTLGYQHLYLDTLPEMTHAIRLYEQLGFSRTPAYNDLPGVYHFALRLSHTNDRVVPVTIWYLEMASPKDLRFKPSPIEHVRFVQVLQPMPELNRFFYATVGGDWYWIDRLGWTYKQWMNYLNNPELETWLFTVMGIPAGYVELERKSDGMVHIGYFGLLPAFLNRQIGGYCLSLAIQRGWEMKTERLCVNTCNLDHPAALQNYLSRGFQIVREEVKHERLPPKPIGPWMGANPLFETNKE